LQGGLKTGHVQKNLGGKNRSREKSIIVGENSGRKKGIQKRKSLWGKRRYGIWPITRLKEMPKKNKKT